MDRSFLSAPRAAYVHVPFCARRCGYCNFTVVADRRDLIETYLIAIQRELSFLKRPRPVDTLYLGGGTPTELSPAQLRRLGRLVREWFPLGLNPEFTVEVNPNDMSDEMVQVLDQIGVNRISLGVQSFDPHKLASLERDHARNDIEQSIRLAQEHFENISMDLMFGVPGERMATWRNDLTMALAHHPNHISMYGLTLERGTSFGARLAKGSIVPIGEELERSLYLAGIQALTDAGMEHYEISNFARPGARSRHNESYWLGQPYYGVGPGAARYVDGRREMNHRSTTTYLKRVMAGQSPVMEVEELEPEDRARERLVFGLRMLQGVDREQFVDATGFDLAQLIGESLERFIGQGLLQWQGSRLQLTYDGLLVSDSIWPAVLRR